MVIKGSELFKIEFMWNPIFGLFLMNIVRQKDVLEIEY